jgi:hypothetical protein
VYEEEVPGSPDPIHDELISGSRAMIDIDITKDGTCLNCGNVILPIALPDWLKESKNIMVYAILVLANDEDGEGGALIGGTVFLDGVTQSIEGGTLTLINGDTEVQYEPPSDWVFDENGEFTDYFEYYAVDADGEISANPALVTITLINQLPVANPDIYDVSHNVTLDITDITSGTIEGLLPGSADTDPDPGDTLSAYLSGGSTTALGGSVALNPDGTFTYTPPADTANVDDSFSYYVTDSYNNSDPTTVTISLTNQVPVANPDIYDVSHNVTLDITDITSGTIEGLLPGSEDTDPDPSDTLSAYLSGGVTTTLGGSVALNPDGTFTYTPPPDTANVDDSFMYYVTDSYDNSDPVSVTISLTNQLPVANPDIYDVSHNVTLDITDITSGTIEGLLPGSEDTDPDPGDTLSAFLSGGGTTTLGGSVVLNTDGTFTYTPPADTANVDDSFSYYVTDSYNNSDPTTVTISLTIQVPVANPDIYDVSHNVTLDITDITSGTIEGLLPGSADIDPDPGDTLSAFLPGGGNMGTTTLGGSVVLNTDGTFTYTPPAGTANVDDSFSYYVTDSYNNSDPTTVTISLTNQVPVANPDIYDVSHNAILSPAVGIIEGLIQAYADIDPDPGDTLRAYLPGKQSSGSTMLGGHVELNTDGTFTYTPPAGAANVDDSFMYYVTDSYNDSNPVPVTITLGMRTLASEEALLNSTPLSPDISDIGQIEDTTTSNNLQWLGEELGLCEGDQQGEDENQCQEITQAYLAGAFLQASDMRPHQAAAQLRELAELLHDSDGIRIAALARVINEFAQPNLPPTPEQFASINQAFTLHVNDGSHYAAAKQWLDALGEYTMLLISEIGWSSDDSVAFVMGKYGPTDTETGNISVIAFIQIHLEDFAG